MSILITGGTGFLGAEIARALVRRKHEHIVLFDLFPDPEAVADLAGNIAIEQGSFADLADVERVFSQYRISHVVHLAYLIGNADSKPGESIRVNVAGTNILFEAAIENDVERTVWASSAAAVGIVGTSSTPTFFTENDSCRPATSMYAACKLFNEGNAQSLARERGFDHIGLRLPATYGRRRSERRGLTPDFFASLFADAATGEAIAAPPADHIVTWLSVKDVVEAFLAALYAHRPAHRIYNVPGLSATVAEGVEIVKDLAPNANVVYGNATSLHLAYLDGELIRTDLGFRPNGDLRESIADALRS